MTVIAYDGKTLAADRRVTSGGDVLLAPECKILSRAAGAIAHCGESASDQTIEKTLERLAEGQRGDLPFKGDAFALVGGHALWLHSGEATMLTAPCAIGSGAEIARGAMAAGKTADEACEIACQLVVTCGDGVDTYTPGEI